MMKKTILLTLLSILTMGMRAADYQYLVFTMNDGTTQAVTASNIAISISGDNLVVSTTTETLATLPLASLTQMEFSNDGTTGISQITANQLTTDADTVIYDLNGRQMPTGAALPKGVYIVKNQNKTLKVTIR
ncbi:MAG: hypothetical protein IJP46_06720 [Prevotella sp.]|nr:hypothetical protein [Prevotella sp.]